MPRPAIVPAVRRLRQGQPPLRRHRYPHVRRDPRRFARGMAKLDLMPQPAGLAISSDLRLFAHTFGAAFLFVSLFIA